MTLIVATRGKVTWMKTHIHTHTHLLFGYSFSRTLHTLVMRQRRRSSCPSQQLHCCVSLPGKEDLNFRHCHGGVVVFLIEKRENNKPPPPLGAFISNQGFIIRNWEEIHNSLGDNKKPVAAASWPAMAAHKPVEWVQAVINRFDDQVCITYKIFVNAIMCLWLVDYITLCRLLLNLWHPCSLVAIGRLCFDMLGLRIAIW